MINTPESTTANPNKKSKFAHSPLSIVALFGGLVEVGFGVAVSVSSGWLQATIFVCMLLLALAILTAFFVVLWKRPWVFYPPSEFGPTTVGAFVSAMREGELSISASAIRSLNLALEDESLLDSIELPGTSIKHRRSVASQVLKGVRARAINNVRASVLVVDARPLQGEHGARWEELYDADMLVPQFLDRIWLRLQPFGPHAYGTIWVLRDPASGKIFDDIGPSWAQLDGDGAKDERRLGESGITGGMSLEVVPNVEEP